MKIRRPAVAGRFYPGSKSDLENIITILAKSETSRIDYSLASKQIIGGMVPHAGYIYSGYEAVHFFEILQKSNQSFDTIIVISPNHSGIGPPVSLDTNDIWKTPLGEVPVDVDLQDLLDLEQNEFAHKNEHSGEVIVPFLQQYCKFPFKIVPIAMKDQSYLRAQKTAESIYKAKNQLNKKILFIASTDFSHFVSPDKGVEQDDFALDQIVNLNSAGLEKIVKQKSISMCGYGPVMTLIEYSHLSLHHPKFETLARGNSAKSHNSQEVVDYISGIIYEQKV